MIPESWKDRLRESAPWVLRFAGRLITLLRWIKIYTRHILGLGLVIVLSILRAFGIRFPYAKSEETELRYHPGSALSGKIAWIVSFTGVSNEPRVLRQASALMEEGWSVVVVGYQGHTETNPDWHFVQMSHAYPYSTSEIQYHEFLRKAAIVLCRLPLGSWARRKLALIHHSNILLWRYHTESVREFAAAHPELKADLVLAHDFHSCEVAFAVKEQFACPISIDCHEYSRGQYAHDPVWMARTRPYVVGMLEHYLPRADHVSTVSDGIADRMNQEEDLRRPVQVIRSMPFFRDCQFRAPGDRLTVLYHGDISEVRGLHMAIESMPLWRGEFDFLLRGNGDAAYIERLRTLAEEHGVSDRVHIEGPVPFDQIIPKANEADIGYFVHYDASPQKRFVLPNKFFEYVAAGLALCVSDLPEMAKLTRAYDMGHLVEDYDVQKIANSINAFDRETIAAFKRNTLAAARELNWDAEKKKMIAQYESLL